MNLHLHNTISIYTRIVDTKCQSHLSQLLDFFFLNWNHFTVIVCKKETKKIIHSLCTYILCICSSPFYFNWSSISFGFLFFTPPTTPVPC